MDPDHDLEIVPLGGVSTQVAAIRGGQVDGCSCLPPVDMLTNREGLTVDVIDRLKDIPQLAGVSYGTLYGLASYNKAHPEVVTAMARAVTRATLLIAHDPEAAKRATRPFLKEMDERRIDAAWQTYLPAFPTSPDITEASYAKELEFEKVRAAAEQQRVGAICRCGGCVVRAQGDAGAGALNDEPLIEYRDVGRRFLTPRRRRDGMRAGQLTVRQGEFLAVVGPSGCGKSTLLNMAAGLLAPAPARCSIAARRCRSPNTDVGYLTQRDTLLPWRTVEDNVAIALELRGELRGRRHRIAHDWLERVGLTGFEKSYPAQLSGGMRRRACLARTLAYEPETILMDEPFGALDAQLRLVMHDELLKLWTGTRKTIVFVTHDLAEALTLADRVAVFSPARDASGRSRRWICRGRATCSASASTRISANCTIGYGRYLEASVRGDVMVN